MEKIRVGIVGAGSIGHCHAAAYKKLPNIELVAVCDIDKERADHFAKYYNIENVYYDHLEMLHNIKLDAVSVCVWNNAHAPVSMNALKNNVNVLCEKPLAMNTEEALEMKSVANEHGKVLIPGFCTRYEEGITLLKNIVEQGDLGNVYYIKSTYLRRHGNPGGWFSDKKRSGGGPVIDLGVHVLDLARFICGGNVVSVSAVTNKINACDCSESFSPHKSADNATIHDVEDFAFALIRMDNGACINLETSWNHHLENDIFQFEVYGDQCGSKAYPKVSLYRDEYGRMCNVNPIHSDNSDSPNYDFDMEIKHFIEVVENKTTPICTADDGVEIMRIVDALYESAKIGAEVRVLR